MVNNFLKNKISKIKELCSSLNIKTLYVFGSVVSADKFTENSDVDFLISFKDGISSEEYTNNYFELQHKLRALLNRNIDIITEKTLSNPFFVENINKTKQLIYEA